ncbi:class I SAM-dependent methyltransferase [Pseudonocardia sichuanensis]|uniref:FkbM family methyltransferase n=1 Tax=Pseudonocardia kunmingensis TaxID=630975 RepID=A0A543D9Y4_9PSEU|nr:class I SAM-dependent methyltransferase [Pseudonocardia kunmingensis]TQM06116.1 FkbM family methyltransferase [Pseudonocardia kunmingensis]
MTAIGELGVYERYVVTAEFYDLMAAPYWAQVGPLLPGLLGGVDTLAGPVVDVGAGTGLSTVAVAEALPEAEVIAVEPAPAMRSVLMSRLAARKDLRDRVTVEPADVFGAALPRPCAGVVALGVLGHFDGPGRARLWRLFADLLAPGAPIVVEVQQPRRVEPVPARCYTRARVGRRTYEGWSEAIPVDAERLRWRMTYRNHPADVRADAGDGPLVEHVTEHVVWPIGPDEAAREATAAGLVPGRGAPGAGLLVFAAPGSGGAR